MATGESLGRLRAWRTEGTLVGSGESGSLLWEASASNSESFHSQEWSISSFPFRLTRNITSHSMKNLAFYSLLQMKDDYTTNSHYLTYTFLFKRLGGSTFWTWEWKGNGFHFLNSVQMFLCCLPKRFDNVAGHHSWIWSSSERIFSIRAIDIMWMRDLTNLLQILKLSVWAATWRGEESMKPCMFTSHLSCFTSS